MARLLQMRALALQYWLSIDDEEHQPTHTLGDTGTSRVRREREPLEHTHLASPPLLFLLEQEIR